MELLLENENGIGDDVSRGNHLLAGELLPSGRTTNRFTPAPSRRLELCEYVLESTGPEEFLRRFGVCAPYGCVAPSTSRIFSGVTVAPLNSRGVLSPAPTKETTSLWMPPFASVIADQNSSLDCLASACSRPICETDAPSSEVRNVPTTDPKIFVNFSMVFTSYED